MDKPDIHALTDLVDKTPMVGNPLEWEDEYENNSDSDSPEFDEEEGKDEAEQPEKVDNELEKQEALDYVWNDWTTDDEDITRYYELLDWDSEFDDIPSYNGAGQEEEDGGPQGPDSSPDKKPKSKTKSKAKSKSKSKSKFIHKSSSSSHKKHS